MANEDNEKSFNKGCQENENYATLKRAPSLITVQLYRSSRKAGNQNDSRNVVSLAWGMDVVQEIVEKDGENDADKTRLVIEEVHSGCDEDPKEDYPALKSGLKQYDVITKIFGNENTPFALIFQIMKHSSFLELTVTRLETTHERCKRLQNEKSSNEMDQKLKTSENYEANLQEREIIKRKEKPMAQQIKQRKDTETETLASAHDHNIFDQYRVQQTGTEILSTFENATCMKKGGNPYNSPTKTYFKNSPRFEATVKTTPLLSWGMSNTTIFPNAETENIVTSVCHSNKNLPTKKTYSQKKALLASPMDKQKNDNVTSTFTLNKSLSTPEKSSVKDKELQNTLNPVNNSGKSLNFSQEIDTKEQTSKQSCLYNTQQSVEVIFPIESQISKSPSQQRKVNSQNNTNQKQNNQIPVLSRQGNTSNRKTLESNAKKSSISSLVVNELDKESGGHLGEISALVQPSNVEKKSLIEYTKSTAESKRHHLSETTPNNSANKLRKQNPNKSENRPTNAAIFSSQKKVSNAGSNSNVSEEKNGNTILNDKKGSQSKLKASEAPFGFKDSLCSNRGIQGEMNSDRNASQQISENSKNIVYKKQVYSISSSKNDSKEKSSIDSVEKVNKAHTSNLKTHPKKLNSLRNNDCKNYEARTKINNNSNDGSDIDSDSNYDNDSAQTESRIVSSSAIAVSSKGELPEINFSKPNENILKKLEEKGVRKFKGRLHKLYVSNTITHLIPDYDEISSYLEKETLENICAGAIEQICENVKDTRNKEWLTIQNLLLKSIREGRDINKKRKEKQSGSNAEASSVRKKVKKNKSEAKAKVSDETPKKSEIDPSLIIDLFSESPQQSAQTTSLKPSLLDKEKAKQNCSSNCEVKSFVAAKNSSSKVNLNDSTGKKNFEKIQSSKEKLKVFTERKEEQEEGSKLSNDSVQNIAEVAISSNAKIGAMLSIQKNEKRLYPDTSIFMKKILKLIIPMAKIFGPSNSDVKITGKLKVDNENKDDKTVVSSGLGQKDKEPLNVFHDYTEMLNYYTPFLLSELTNGINVKHNLYSKTWPNPNPEKMTLESYALMGKKKNCNLSSIGAAPQLVELNLSVKDSLSIPLGSLLMLICSKRRINCLGITIHGSKNNVMQMDEESANSKETLKQHRIVVCAYATTEDDNLRYTGWLPSFVLQPTYNQGLIVPVTFFYYVLCNIDQTLHTYEGLKAVSLLNEPIKLALLNDCKGQDYFTNTVGPDNKVLHVPKPVWSHILSCISSDTSQTAVIKGILSDFGKGVQLVAGFPGTGKTHIIPSIVTGLFNNIIEGTTQNVQSILICCVSEENADKMSDCVRRFGLGSQNTSINVVRFKKDSSKAVFSATNRNKSSRCVVTTLSDAGTTEFKNFLTPVKGNSEFDTLIIDDAAHIPEPLCLIPFKYNPARVILLGDIYQLAPPTSDKAQKFHVHSMFSRLSANKRRKFYVLKKQHRMNAEICSQFFCDVEEMGSENYAFDRKAPWHRNPYFSPIKLWRGSKSQKISSFILDLLKSFIAYQKRYFAERYISIGILTFQEKEAFKWSINSLIHNYTDTLEINIFDMDDLPSIEVDIFVIACNVSSLNYDLHPYMNTILSRSRESLWIVANSSFQIQPMNFIFANLRQNNLERSFKSLSS